jgi:hypothetical protein
MGVHAATRVATCIVEGSAGFSGRYSLNTPGCCTRWPGNVEESAPTGPARGSSVPDRGCENMLRRRLARAPARRSTAVGESARRSAAVLASAPSRSSGAAWRARLLPRCRPGRHATRCPGEGVPRSGVSARRSGRGSEVLRVGPSSVASRRPAPCRSAIGVVGPRLGGPPSRLVHASARRLALPACCSGEGAPSCGVSARRSSAAAGRPAPCRSPALWSGRCPEVLRVGLGPFPGPASRVGRPGGRGCARPATAVRVGRQPPLPSGAQCRCPSARFSPFGSCPRALTDWAADRKGERETERQRER